MSILKDFRRVSKTQRCPICGRPDWCLTSLDDPPSRAICTRISVGAQRALTGRDGSEIGHLHVLRDDGQAWTPRPITIPITVAGWTDFGRLADEYREAVESWELARLADGLGVSRESLQLLGIGWSRRYCAWSFPMSDADGKVRGIRLRYPDGRKLAICGGREGLFVPVDLQPADKLLICEGPTDTAALIDLGFAVVGRPSCSGGVGLLVDLVRRRRQREVVMIADGDEPGRRGADNLASILVAYAASVRIVEPPQGVKDARAWKRCGATPAEVISAIDAVEPRRLKITTSLVARKAGCRNGR